MIKYLKTNNTASKYIASGLLKTLAQTLSGLIILRWLKPDELGEWQSYTVYVGYLQILTLGVTSGLNRELPYLIGKGDEKLGIERLKTAGFFITTLSISLILFFFISSFIFYVFGYIEFNTCLKITFAFSIGSMTIQTNFLGATFRSSDSFNKLTKIHLINTLLYFLLIPVIYFFQIWGYIAYQLILSIMLYVGYMYFRPYKVSYMFSYDQFKILVSVGFKMYFWNYLGLLSRTIPRLILVTFGSPLLVGLFSPAGSINAALINLPNYVNRYLYPKMSFLYGSSNDDKKKLYNYTLRSFKILFIVMLTIAVILCVSLFYLFPILFPKYVEGLLAAQITIFSGVFFSVNTLFHASLNSMKSFKAIRIVMIFRLLFSVFFSYLFFLLTNNLLLSVAIGSVLSEIFNLFNYLYYLKKVVNEK